MIRKSILATTALLTVLIPACGRASSREGHGEGLAPVANDQSAGAELENVSKAKSAAAEADLKALQARTDFTKAREDYRHKIVSGLSDLDRKVVVLERKAKASDGKNDNPLEMNLTQIRADRYAFMNNYKSLDGVSDANWDVSRARLDKEWVALADLVDKS